MSKFKNTEELEKAYKELEKEFTKKSQKLAEVEKTNYVTLLHNEMDNLLNDYAKRRIADLEAKLAESNESHHKNIVELTEMATEKDRKIEELKQQLAEKEKELNYWKDGTIICKWTDAENKVKDLEHQLAEKEEQLKGCIRPKFKIGQEVFVLDWTGQLRSGEIGEIQTNQVRLMPLITYLVDFYGSYCDDDLENDYFEEKDVFATKEEAQAKLKKLGERE